MRLLGHKINSVFILAVLCWLPLNAAEIDRDLQFSISSPAALARARLKSAITEVCKEPLPSHRSLGERLKLTVSELPVPASNAATEVTRMQFLYSDAATLRVDLIRHDMQRRQLVLRYTVNNVGTTTTARPLIEVMLDAACQFQRGREIVYAGGRAVALVAVDGELLRGEITEPINPSLEPSVGTPSSSDSVPVAIVDSGVDYRSPRIASRLHRDRDGNVVGYDYWDDDNLPFDANPSRSPFYPQRHGTRIANIVIGESTVASIAAYRYPRDDPSKFGDLVDSLAGHGIRLVNLSMGSKKRTLWHSFEDAVRRHPEVLFIVSAGNNGFDLDQKPIYPAAFELDNLLTVTSATADGQLARGSNWGSTSVDLMIAAEEMLTRGFADQLRQVSGSSYAAARITALASCLLAARPDSSTQKLKQSIVSMAKHSNANETLTRYGLLSNPLSEDRGSCSAAIDQISEIERREFLTAVTNDPDRPLLVAMTAVIVEDSGWSEQKVRDTLEQAIEVLGQCGIERGAVELVRIQTPVETRLLSDSSMQALAEFVDSPRVRVYFVEDTLRENEFGAEAIGRVNARRRPDMRDSVWMTSWVPDPAISLAHELFHVLADSGLHNKDPKNLMAAVTEGLGGQPSGYLTDSQCGQLRNIGLGNALITRQDF